MNQKPQGGLGVGTGGIDSYIMYLQYLEGLLLRVVIRRKTLSSYNTLKENDHEEENQANMKPKILI